MKIGTVKRDSSESSASDVGTIDVPFRNIFTGLTINGIVAALISVLTFIGITYPQFQSSAQLEESQFNLATLNFVLRHQNDTIREESLRLLLGAGILQDESGVIQKLLEQNKIPDWSEYDKDIVSAIMDAQAPKKVISQAMAETEVAEKLTENTK